MELLRYVHIGENLNKFLETVYEEKVKFRFIFLQKTGFRPIILKTINFYQKNRKIIKYKIYITSP